MRYEVTEHKHVRKSVEVDARNEYSAVAKAHRQLTGERVASRQVTWDGLVARVGIAKYNKPVVVGV